MKHLYLLRHAKSGRADAGLDDRDRPLEARGVRACAVMGPLLARSTPAPQLALTSTARRAVDTVEQLLPHFPSPPPLRIEPDLYLATPSQLADALLALEDSLEAVLMVGHNPGLHQFAFDRVGSGDPALAERLARKLPTAALVRLRFDDDRWSRVATGRGELLRFVTPRELGAS